MKINRFVRLVSEAISAPQAAQRDLNCPHDDWTVSHSNNLGYGTCAKCGEEVCMSDLLSAWKARIEREIEERLTKAR